MKDRTLFKLLLAAVAVLCLFTIIFLHIKQSGDSGQRVSFVVEHYFESEDVPQDTASVSSKDDSAQEDDDSTVDPGDIDNGSDLENALFSTDLYLDKIKDFQAKVERAADQRRETAENSSADDMDEVDHYDDMDEVDHYDDVDSSSPAPAKAVIIDTDFASDSDDVVAVRLALCLQDAGMLDIRGIALSTTYSRTPLAVHALCYQDGYGNIPVAMDTSGNGVQVHTEYVDVMYDMARSRNDYEQPVQMYRRILSESDTKVHIITLGFLQNIQALMNSKPDQYSPLTGLELISEKVDTLYITGGNSTGKPSFNFYWTGEKVINAARDVSKNFPARVVFLQSDLGDDTFCGQFYQTRDSSRRDIVTKALYANDQYGGVVAWDVFSVWCATQDINNNLDASFLELEQGNQYISHTGATQWTADAAGRHHKMYKHMQGLYYSQIMNGILLDKLESYLHLLSFLDLDFDVGHPVCPSAPKPDCLPAFANPVISDTESAALVRGNPDHRIYFCLFL